MATLKRLPPEVVTGHEPVFGRRARRRRRTSSAPICSSTAITSRPCACWPGSASRATCSTMRSCCSRPCSTLAPDYRAARHDYARVLLERHKYQRAREELDKLLELEPREPTVPHALRDRLRRPWASMRRRIAALPRAARRTRRARPICTCRSPIALKTLGRRDGSHRGLPRRRRRPPELRRCLLESRQLQDLSLHGRGDRAHARRGSGARHAARRSLSPVLRARQGATRIAASTKSPGATTSAAMRSSDPKAATGPRSSRRNTRKQIEVCTRGVLRSAATASAPRAPIRFSSSDCRASGSTLLEQILASHSQVEGTQELSDIPAHRARAAGPRSRSRQPALPRRARAT